MLQYKKKAAAVLLVLACVLSLAACGKKEPDPHAGMVNVNTGGADNWIYPAEGVPVANFQESEFVSDGNIVRYTGSAYESALGIDVSFYQGDIDWKAVADAGVEFAMIRCGYRGYSQGDIFEDEKFQQNMEGALAAGLRVGVYFFSQSVGAHEAAEEALYVLDKIKGYDVTMPVAFDWEPMDGGRSDGVDIEALTNSADVFCKVVQDAGYQPCVYFFRSLAYYDYDLSQLADYTFWVGAPGTYPDFYYAHNIWQFSFTGKIDGIQGDVDLNLELIPVETPAPTDQGNG